MRLITDNDTSPSKCYCDLPRDWGDAWLEVPCEDFIGPPTKAEVHADLFHSYWDPDCTLSHKEIDDLLEQIK